MSFTTSHLTAIETAIASGSLEVTYEGKTIKYASMEDLERRYDFIRSKLIQQGDLADTNASRPRASYAAFSKA